MEKIWPLQQKALEQLNIHRKRWNCNPYHALHTKTNPERTMHLNVKPKAIKLLEAIEEKLCDFELGKDFLDTTPKSRSMKEKTINRISLKFKTFFKRHC